MLGHIIINDHRNEAHIDNVFHSTCHDDCEETNIPLNLPRKSSAKRRLHAMYWT